MAKYGWEVTTAPSGSVATTAEIRRQLSIAADDHYHDAQLDNMMTAAVSLFEHSTRILLISRIITLTMDCFPDDGDPIDLPVYPVTTFTSITVYQSDVATLWAGSNYVTDLVSRPCRVAPIRDGIWTTSDNRISAVSMVMTVGYALADIPLDIKHSLLMLVAHWFENRETSVMGTLNDIPFGVRAIWDRYNMGETYLVGSHL